jgi:hypothetical protein
MRQSIEKAFPQVVTGGCLEIEVAPGFELFDNPAHPQRCFIRRNPEQDRHFLVRNPFRKPIHFLAIDKCVLNDDADTHCDCALFDEQTFCFIEMKDAGVRIRKSHRKTAYQQLKSTILLFRDRDVFQKNTEIEAIISFASKSGYPARTSSSADAALMFEIECNAKLLEGNEKEFT